MGGQDDTHHRVTAETPSAPTLAALFVEQLCLATDATEQLDQQRLTDALAQLLEQATTAWPELSVQPERFVVHLAERIGASEPDPIAALTELRAADLYLACGCALADRNAVAHFHERFVPVIDAVVKRLERSGVSPEDARQMLFERLLVSKGDRPPALALYAGRGDLAAYVRMAALHTGLKQLAKRKRSRSSSTEALAELSTPDDDPEMATLKQRYRDQFKSAFQAALAGLSSSQRNLLRYHYLSGLTTRQIASLTSVAQSTVTRRLAQVRATLLSATRRALIEELQMPPEEIRNIMGMVESQIDLSIERVLTETD